MSSQEFIVWADVETTGIEDRDLKDGSQDQLLQVAILITDGDYNILDEAGFEAKVFYDESETRFLRDELANDFVRDMHTKTGLWDALPQGMFLDELDEAAFDYIHGIIGDADRPRLGGNSITLDRNFLREFLPKTFGSLHYRSYDVTSISGFMSKRVTAKDKYNKGETSHEALDDIRGSIREMKYWDGVLRSALEAKNA